MKGPINKKIEIWLASIRWNAKRSQLYSEKLLKNDDTFILDLCMDFKLDCE